MRFYYPGVDSSQFSLASHNSPEDSPEKYDDRCAVVRARRHGVGSENAV